MIHEIIKNRHSTRAFAETLLDGQNIINLLEAARWAPSAMNGQPWRFIAISKDDPENYERMIDALNERNRIWAVKAPLFIIALAKVDPDNFTNSIYSFYDLGLAVENLSLQATADGLYAHQMGGFDKEKAISFFEIPKEYIPVVVIAVGNKGDINDLPLHLKDRELAERKRRPINETLFEGKFGLHGKITQDLQNYD